MLRKSIGTAFTLFLISFFFFGCAPVNVTNGIPDSGQINVSEFAQSFDPDRDSFVVFIEDVLGNFYGFRCTDNANTQ